MNKLFNEKTVLLTNETENQISIANVSLSDVDGQDFYKAFHNLFIDNPMIKNLTDISALNINTLEYEVFIHYLSQYLWPKFKNKKPGQVFLYKVKYGNTTTVLTITSDSKDATKGLVHHTIV